MFTTGDGFFELERRLRRLGGSPADTTTLQIGPNPLLLVVAALTASPEQPGWSGDSAAAVFGAEQSSDHGAEENNDGNKNQGNKQCGAFKIQG